MCIRDRLRREEELRGGELLELLLRELLLLEELLLTVRGSNLGVSRRVAGTRGVTALWL